MLTPRERYHRDPAFHRMVDLFVSLIDKAEFTPTEIREAAMLAQIKYEETAPAARMFYENGKIRDPKKD